MRKRKYVVTLTREEREQLVSMLRSGKAAAPTRRRSEAGQGSSVDTCRRAKTASTMRGALASRGRTLAAAHASTTHTTGTESRSSMMSHSEEQQLMDDVSDNGHDHNSGNDGQHRRLIPLDSPETTLLFQS